MTPRFVRNAIKADLLQFGIPFLAVFVAALVVSGRDGYHGLTPVLWELVTRPASASELSAPNLAGLGVFVVGLTTAIVAVATLRRFYFSTLVIQEGHRVIRHGLYRCVRHPIYFGVLVAVMGVPVYASSAWGGATMALLIPVFLNRIRLEERLLIEEFGDEYRSYQKTTSKLVPFIY